MSVGSSLGARELFTRRHRQCLRAVIGRLGTQPGLLLNRKDKLQKARWDITDKIYKCDNLTERNEMDVELIIARDARRDVIMCRYKGRQSVKAVERYNLGT